MCVHCAHMCVRERAVLSDICSTFQHETPALLRGEKEERKERQRQIWNGEGQEREGERKQKIMQQLLSDV